MIGGRHVPAKVSLKSFSGRCVNLLATYLALRLSICPFWSSLVLKTHLPRTIFRLAGGFTKLQTRCSLSVEISNSMAASQSDEFRPEVASLKVIEQRELDSVDSST